MTPKPVSPWPWVVVAAALFALALCVDQPVNHAVMHTRLAEALEAEPARLLLRLPGIFWQLPLATGLLLLWIPRRGPWLAVLMGIGSALAGGLAALFKGVFGRSRPETLLGTPKWELFRGGWYGFFHQQNVSFVSGDAAQAFVWAETLSIAVPALRLPAYAVAALTCGQRVCVGAHYPSDVVGGAIVGVVTVRCLARILRPALDTLDDPGADGPDADGAGPTVPASEGGAATHAGP